MNRNARLILIAVVAASSAFLIRLAVRARSSGLDRPRAEALRDALSDAYLSTLSALDPGGDDEAEFAARDARAQTAADALQRTVADVRPALASKLAPAVASFVDHVTAAQLQIAAFAINRKNRGMPDSSQSEAEREDRDLFKRNVQPIFERLVDALA